MNLFKYILIALLFTFLGSENPELVEAPKKYIKAFFKKDVNNKDSNSRNIQSKTTKKIQDSSNLVETEVVEGNSFDLTYRKVLDYDDRTASFYVETDNNKAKFEVFLQDGIKIIDNNAKKCHYLQTLPLKTMVE